MSQIKGVYNATPPTINDGQNGDVQLDNRLNIKVTLATGLNKTDDEVTTYAAGCTMTEVDLSTDADVTVSSSPCFLLGIYVNVVLSAHDANILDGGATKLVLPASLAAGTKIDCHSATFATSLIVNSDNAATGKVVLFWRALS